MCDFFAECSNFYTGRFAILVRNIEMARTFYSNSANIEICIPGLFEDFLGARHKLVKILLDLFYLQSSLSKTKEKRQVNVQLVKNSQITSITSFVCGSSLSQGK